MCFWKDTICQKIEINKLFRDQKNPHKNANFLFCAPRMIFALPQSTTIFSFLDTLDHFRESPSTTCHEVSFVATNERISLSMKSKYNDLYYSMICTMYSIAVLFLLRLFRKLIFSDFPKKTSIWHTLSPK